MAGFLNKALDFLGLSDAEPYDDYPTYDERPAQAPVRRAGNGGPQGGGYEDMPNVRALPVTQPESGIGSIQIQQIQTQRPTVSTSVRPLSPSPASTNVHVVAPTSFSEAQEIGERFRSAQPVIINLTGVDRDLKRRLVDFASGLTFGLNGDMKKVAESVFMLTPSNVEVSADEKRRLQESGLYRS
jgi:cell division inhibitor SepF